MSFVNLISVLAIMILVPTYSFAEGRSKIKELAAIQTQEQSIQKLKKFLNTHPGDSREPDFLIRLSDLYFEKSGISFQYTEGESVKTVSKLYTDSLKQAVNVLTQVINKYPFHASISDAYFKRGKAFKELKKLDLSKNDYLKLASIAPQYYRLDSALMDLADYAQDGNLHEEALKYLLQIEKNEKSQYYTIAIHKAAWSYFNLTNFSLAISYLKKEITIYQTKNNDLPYLETAYQDLALFYFEGINKKSNFANVEEAVNSFQVLSKNQFDSQKRPFFGIIVTRFAKLLKAYQLSTELDQLKNILIKKYDQLPETLEIAILIYEYHFDRHEYNKLISLLNEADQIRIKINSPDLNNKFEKTVSQTLSQLQTLVTKNKQSTDIDQLLIPLMEMTDFLQSHLTIKNNTTVLAIYSMAETSFSIKKYSMATKYYVELLKPEVTLPAELTKEKILLNLISSRFQELKNMNLVNEKLNIVKLTSEIKKIKKEDKELILEWINWVFDPINTKNIDTFAFQLEAFKLKYDYIDRQEALKGLESFSLQNSSSEEAKIAASIVLDTLHESLEWNKIYEVCENLLKKKNWNDSKFIDKIQDSASNAHLKITLITKDSNEILNRTKECVHQFKNPSILLQCKLIQIKTWIQLSQFSDAELGLHEINKNSLKNDDLKTVTLLKADVFQKQGKLLNSANEMEHYLELTNYQDAEMSKHIIQIYWFQRNFKKIQPFLNNSKLCNAINNNFCEQFIAAIILTKPYSAKQYTHYFKETLKSPKNSISLYALAALEQSPKIAFQDRLVLLQRLANHWEYVDPFLQLQFLEMMKKRVNQTIESITKTSSSIAPISSANESSIEKRMRLIQDIDLTFAKVMKLNWIEIKINTATELQLVYQKLTHDLKTIGTPDQLIQPFAKKQQQIIDATQQLVSMSFHPKTESQNINLLDLEVKEKIPSAYWEEWSSAVKQQKPDYLYYLISLRSQDDFSPLLRGLVLTSLLKSTAATEGMEMIKTAPKSTWKDSISMRVSQ